jgi:hypothetical protein
MAETPKLDKALQRFDDAITELEAAFIRVKERPAPVAPEAPSNGEVEALRADRAKLAGELDEVRGNANRLMENNHKAAEKVASAMVRIKSVLGE